MDSEKGPYFPLILGPVTLGVRFNTRENTEAVARYFDAPLQEGNPDLLLDFTLVDHAEYPDIPESLIQTKQWNEGFFSIADNLFRGRNNPEKKRWEIEVKAIMTKGQITRVFEQFLYQAFYSACVKVGINAFLLHSSAVSVNGSGFLFVGASGMGKSTIAELSRNYGVINDEMNILSPKDNKLYLHSSPFNAYFKQKSAETSPVRAIFLLRHAKSCRLEQISPAKAAAEITGQVVPPLGLEDSFTPAVASTMMNIAVNIVTTVPVYLLYFPVEGGFWPLILEKFP